MNLVEAIESPFKALGQEVVNQITSKTQVAVNAALDEVPILGALLKGEEVTLEMKLKLVVK